MWFSVNSLNWISNILESFVLPGKIVAIIGISISSVINDIFDVLCFNNWGVYNLIYILLVIKSIQAKQVFIHLSKIIITTFLKIWIFKIDKLIINLS